MVDHVSKTGQAPLPLLNSPKNHRVHRQPVPFLKPPVDHILRFTSGLVLATVCLLTAPAGADEALSGLPAESALPTDGKPSAEALEFFEKRVRPVLVNRCERCHGAAEALSGLRLDSREAWMTGGERGPAIVPGDPEKSLLIRAIRYHDAELQMPPEDDGGRISDSEVNDLTEWVRNGAVDPRSGRPAAARDFSSAREHWAFQPLQRPDVPEDQHPIDFLINQRMAAEGYVAVPRADSATLARRAAFVLHGVPADDRQRNLAAENFPALIDHLLESPRYGERWARHWLDVARYADTKDGVLMYGDGRIRPFAYTYRDYVIRSFNEDKPYDRFLQEQIAADQMGLAENAPELAAMGFLTLGRMFDNNPHDVIDDQIDVVTRGILGLTVTCARCHDHKFDPVPIADYYSLYGVFASSNQPFERPRIEAPSAEGEAFETDLSAKLTALQTMRKEQHELQVRTARERVADYLVKVATTEPDVSETSVFFLSLLPDDLRPQIVNRWRRLIARRLNSEDPVFGPWHDLSKRFSDDAATPASDIDFDAFAMDWKARGIDARIVEAVCQTRPGNLKQVAEAYGSVFQRVAAEDGSAGTAGADVSASAADPIRQLVVGPTSPGWFNESQAWHYMSRHEKDKYGGMVSELDIAATKAPAAAGRAMVLKDADEPYQPVVFRRGDPTQPGDAVPRRFLQVLSEKDAAPFQRGSGRYELAQALTAPENPLTARVWVNRVWMHHFGEPLVENPGDFGLRTEKPLHADVLDFLASELIRNGWKLHPIHRLLMTSAAWQRSSSVDPDVLRPLFMATGVSEPTAMLSAIERQQAVDPSSRYLWKANRRRMDLESMRDSMLAVSGQLDLRMYGRPLSIDDETNLRRTVFSLVERQSIPNIVRSFDVASADASVARRTMTTVPQQALFAMNSPMMTRISVALAKQVETSGAGAGSPATAGASPEALIGTMYRRVYGRDVSTEEAQLAKEFLASGTTAELAQALLMSNEFLFVD